MIGISWTEMLIIGVVALIVIGPKELPAMMQRIGKVVGTIRRMGGEFQRELNRTTGLNQVTDLRKSITEPLKKTTAEIAREFNTTTSTGTKPSGVIKPADPKAESVVAEIESAAGKGATATGAAVMKPTEQAPLKTGPAKETAAKAPRYGSAQQRKPGVTVTPTAKAAGAEAPAKKAPEEAGHPTRKPATRKAAAKPKTTKQAAAKQTPATTAEATAPAKPRKPRKPAAKKPAADAQSGETS